MSATATEVLEISGGRPLVGPVDVPGDKSISHRALLLSALAEGTSTITGLSAGDDVDPHPPRPSRRSGPQCRSTATG